MKAIILFDGSPACVSNLEVACREAYEEQFLSGEQAKSVSMLVIIFECWPTVSVVTFHFRQQTGLASLSGTLFLNW